MATPVTVKAKYINLSLTKNCLDNVKSNYRTKVFRRREMKKSKIMVGTYALKYDKSVTVLRSHLLQAQQRNFYNLGYKVGRLCTTNEYCRSKLRLNVFSAIYI